MALVYMGSQAVPSPSVESASGSALPSRAAHSSLDRGTDVATRIDTAGFCAVLAALTILGFASAPVAAQEEPGTRSWSLGLWMGGGYQWSAGRIANNSASDNPNLRLLETVANLNPSPVLAGGVAVTLPKQELSVRLGFEATSGAEVVGQVAICDLVGGSICIPEVAPARIRALSSSVRMLAGNPLSSVRPVFAAGFGLRRFDFDIPDCPPRSADDESLICWAVTDLYRDPLPHYFLRVGVGLQANTGPVTLGMDVLGNTGRYRGGTGRTDGNWYHDLRIQISTGLSLY